MNIEFLEKPGESDISSIYDGLHAFNLSYFPVLNDLEFGVFIRNDELQIIGGAVGNIILSAMNIKYLWLNESIRGQGMGRQIMNILETNARNCQLKTIVLDTYSFQAPTFYTKLGFVQVGKFENYPCEGVNKLFFQKNLAN